MQIRVLVGKYYNIVERHDVERQQINPPPKKKNAYNAIAAALNCRL